MADILIFGGTTEGRLLAEYCVKHHIKAIISVVTEYGQELLPDSPFLQILHGELDKHGLENLVQAVQPDLILDATHPYAKVITDHLTTICRKYNHSYLRVLRDDEVDVDGELPDDSIIKTDSLKDAITFLNNTSGAILVTTGSKDLEHYRELSEYKERLFVRVLPTADAMNKCQELGIKGNHIIGMQGPFSKELNKAMIQQLKISYLVTKAAGAVGGYSEKLEAAKECKIHTIVIGRPEMVQGVSLNQAILYLRRHIKKREKEIALIGLGMGNGMQITQEAKEKLQSSQVVFGARRLIESTDIWVKDIPKYMYYKSLDILTWLELNPDVDQISVVYSGDTGFYSGAYGLYKALDAEPWKSLYQIKVFPGISSVSYFCAKINMSWEHLFLTSFHGRDGNICDLIKKHDSLFLLLGGGASAETICRQLYEAGYGDRKAVVGERLSYADERITRGYIRTLMENHFDSLSVMIILQEVQGSDEG